GQNILVSKNHLSVHVFRFLLEPPYPFCHFLWYGWPYLIQREKEICPCHYLALRPYGIHSCFSDYILYLSSGVVVNHLRELVKVHVLRQWHALSVHFQYRKSRIKVWKRYFDYLVESSWP